MDQIEQLSQGEWSMPTSWIKILSAYLWWTVFHHGVHSKESWTHQYSNVALLEKLQASIIEEPYQWSHLGHFIIRIQFCVVFCVYISHCFVKLIPWHCIGKSHVINILIGWPIHPTTWGLGITWDQENGKGNSNFIICHFENIITLKGCLSFCFFMNHTYNFLVIKQLK